VTSPQPTEPRRDTDDEAARGRLDMDYPVAFDRLPDAAHRREDHPEQ
jgi:hypothetical protein